LEEKFMSSNPGQCSGHPGNYTLEKVIDKPINYPKSDELPGGEKIRKKFLHPSLPDFPTTRGCGPGPVPGNREYGQGDRPGTETISGSDDSYLSQM
jgi:hypothetical protein